MLTVLTIIEVYLTYNVLGVLNKYERCNVKLASMV